MKKLYSLAFAILSSSVLMAQIPNPSFETWTGGNPDGWFTFNVFIPGAAVSVTPAYDGQLACRINTIDFFGTISPGAIVTGDLDNPFIRTQTSSNIVSFWYKLNNAGIDALVAFVGTKNTGSQDETESGFIATQTTNVFTQAAINLPSSQYDSIAVGFLLNSTDTTTGAQPSINSFAIIDDIRLGNPVSLADVDGFDFFESVYPTPSNQSANLVYSLNQNSEVNIRIFNLEGKLIENVLQTNQAPGRYRAEVFTENYANGVYIAEINLNGKVAKQKMIVAH